MTYLNNKLRQKIKTVLNSGGVIAFVTDTVWGLGCLPQSEEAVKKIYAIKNREGRKPLILMSNSVENLLPYANPLTEKAKKFIEIYFPGALTLVVPKSVKAPDYVTSGLNTVGIRVPDNKVFQEICEAVPGHVLATTSANLSQKPSAKTFTQVFEKTVNSANLIIEDFGEHAKGLESTVVSVLEDEIKILRQGAVKIDL